MSMKTLLAIILGTLITSHASAKPAVFCSLYHSKPVIAVATAHSKNDKNRHCTVSCMLALKCNDNEVMLVGMLKEFKDVFGPGDADAEDMEANALGISLAAKGAARNNQQCLKQCDLYYR
jgi:hypothetical protein